MNRAPANKPSFNEVFHDKGTTPDLIRFDVLSLGSRIMCVADVFTAVTEDRPYRKGMDEDEAIEVLSSMVKNRALDAGIVAALQENRASVNDARVHSQRESMEQYQKLVG